MMLGFKVLGIILTIVIVGGILVWYAIKQDMFHLQKWFRTKRRKKYQNNLNEIRELIQGFGGLKNIATYQKNEAKKISFVLKRTPPPKKNFPSLEFCKIQEINQREYDLEFEKDEDRNDVFRKICFIFQ